jgi:hypothetical protein
MKVELGCAHITPVGGNIFLDLGFNPVEAAALKSASQKIISDKLALKERLMGKIASGNVEQGQVMLGVEQPKKVGWGRSPVDAA